MAKGNLSIFEVWVQEERHGGAGRNSSESLIHNTFMIFDNGFLIFKSVFCLSKIHKLFRF